MRTLISHIEVRPDRSIGLQIPLLGIVPTSIGSAPSRTTELHPRKDEVGLSPHCSHTHALPDIRDCTTAPRPIEATPKPRLGHAIHEVQQVRAALAERPDHKPPNPTKAVQTSNNCTIRGVNLPKVVLNLRWDLRGTLLYRCVVDSTRGGGVM